MTRRAWYGLTLLIIMGSGMLLSGCAGTSPPARFYTLSAMDAGEGSVVSRGVREGIGVGPLSLPDYLDRQQMVIRSGKNELQIAEYHLWAGSLQDEVLRVLSANISRLLSSERVYAFPWSRSHLVAYSVPVRISQFDGAPGGKVFLRVQWSVIDSGKKVLVTRESAIEESVGGNEYAALAAAQSRAIERLSREIAAAVASLPAEK